MNGEARVSRNRGCDYRYLGGLELSGGEGSMSSMEIVSRCVDGDILMGAFKLLG